MTLNLSPPQLPSRGQALPTSTPSHSPVRSILGPQARPLFSLSAPQPGVPAATVLGTGAMTARTESAARSRTSWSVTKQQLPGTPCPHRLEEFTCFAEASRSVSCVFLYHHIKTFRLCTRLLFLLPLLFLCLILRACLFPREEVRKSNSRIASLGSLRQPCYCRAHRVTSMPRHAITRCHAVLGRDAAHRHATVHCTPSLPSTIASNDITVAPFENGLSHRAVAMGHGRMSCSRGDLCGLVFLVIELL